MLILVWSRFQGIYSTCYTSFRSHQRNLFTYGRSPVLWTCFYEPVWSNWQMHAMKCSHPELYSLSKWLQEMGPAGNYIISRSSDGSVQTNSSHGLTSGLLTGAQPTLMPVRFPSPILQLSLGSWEGSSKVRLWLRWPKSFPLLVTGTVISTNTQDPHFSHVQRNHVGEFLLHSSELEREWEKRKGSLLLCPRRIMARWGWS